MTSRPRLFLILLVALVASACGSSDDIAAGSEGDSERDWVQVDDAPIDGRTSAAIVGLDGRAYVFGGWDFLCPATADCAFPETPPLVDGAVLDLATGTWDAIVDMPLGIREPAVAAAGGKIYALSRCDKHPSCPLGKSLVRYDPTADSWEVLPGPDEAGFFDLATFGETVVAYSQSDEVGPVGDFVFDTATDRWVELPGNPMPRTFDRFAVEVDGDLYLFGSAMGDGPRTKLASVLDGESLEWTELKDSGTAGYQVWAGGDRLVLNPHFGDSAGGVYDPAEDRWGQLPDPPKSETWSNDLAGVMGGGEATFAGQSGWVLDVEEGRWVEIPDRPGADSVNESMVTTVGTDLVVYGGVEWQGDDGRLISDTWVWGPGRN